MVLAELGDLDDGAAPDDLGAAAAGSDVPLRADVCSCDARRRAVRLPGGDCVFIVVKTHAEFDAHNSAEGRVLSPRVRPPPSTAGRRRRVYVPCPSRRHQQ